jgi:hypothetical protein
VDAYGSVRVWVEEQNAGDATLLCLVLPYGTANPRSESLSGASPAAGGGNFRSRLFLSLPALHVSRVTRESSRPCQTNSAPVTIRQVFFFVWSHLFAPLSLAGRTFPRRQAAHGNVDAGVLPDSRNEPRPLSLALACSPHPPIRALPCLESRRSSEHAPSRTTPIHDG